MEKRCSKILACFIVHLSVASGRELGPTPMLDLHTTFSFGPAESVLFFWSSNVAVSLKRSATASCILTYHEAIRVQYPKLYVTELRTDLEPCECKEVSRLHEFTTSRAKFLSLREQELGTLFSELWQDSLAICTRQLVELGQSALKLIFVIFGRLIKLVRLLRACLGDLRFCLHLTEATSGEV